ncbi:lysine transporter LysE [Streptomyces sp. NPDC006393]|uniref:lysine transporter LysE n=1 Tax=Streptomyces sp. NPDC006393 TaxID=3156763 RepID=UPI0033D8D1A5
MARKAGRTLGEFLGEVVLEVLFAAVACVLLAGLVFVSLWGWRHSPLLTGGVGGTVLAFLGYGAWEMFRPARSGRRGRLAAAALASFTAAAVFAYYASSCNCA